MPLTKLNLQSEEFKFLKPLIDCRKEIVEAHRKVKDDGRDHHFCLSNWSVILLQRGKEKFNNMNNFPSISKFSDSIPDKLKSKSILISRIYVFIWLSVILFSIFPAGSCP